MAHGIFDLSGKTAVVTGASYGLGVSFANILAKYGANVVGVARSFDKLQAVGRQIEADHGVKFLSLRADISEYDQCERFTAEALNAFGRIDILVNNAGIADARAQRSERSEPEWFLKMIMVDLVGLWYCTRAIAPQMLKAGGGSIINIASIFGMGGFEGRTPGYFASKGGVNNLTKMLACEWGDRKVRVNALAPTFFMSEMTREILSASGFADHISFRTPMGRLGEEADLEGPFIFLASEASAFVTGVVLPIDGGLTASNGYHAGPYPHDHFDPDGLGHPITPDAAS